MEEYSVSKKDIWLWALYDFANSIAFVGFILYFGLWFVSDMGGSDVWISFAVAGSTVLLLCTLPILGHLSDRMQRRMPFLAGLSFLCMAFLFGLGLVTESVDALSSTKALLVIGVYFFVQYFYQASMAFYNAYLRDLSASGVSVEKISGWGMAMGQLGNFAGLAIFLPITLGTISLFGLSPKPAIFIVGALLFFLFFLPTWLFLKERPSSVPYHSANVGLGSTLRNVIGDIRRMRQYPGVLPYLITYYLFADAILTLSLFAFLYFEVVGGLDDMQKNLAGFSGVIFTFLGALSSPFFARMCGGGKKALGIFLAVWALCMVLFALATSVYAFMFVAALNGFVFGVLFALSRAFYSRLIPKDKQAELFSIYVLFERAASILGPLVWSGVAFAFSSYGPDRYRFSVFALAIIVALSLIPLRYVKEPPSETTE